MCNDRIVIVGHQDDMKVGDYLGHDDGWILLILLLLRLLLILDGMVKEGQRFG